MRALIYLENQENRQVFDKEFIDTMDFINSHIATSIENAQLYENLEREVERRTKELHEKNTEIELQNKKLSDSFQSLELALVTVENQKEILEKKNKKIQQRNKDVLEKSRILKKQNREISKQKEEIQLQNEKLNASHQELEFALITLRNQRNELDEKNRDITDSIRYAQRIQSAIYPGEREMKELFPESFVFFRPRDIVSGDFYWMEKVDALIGGKLKSIYFAAAVDCTGHGVPGALLSIFGNNLLHECTQDAGQLPTPAGVLECLDKGINRMMSANGNQNTGDGMDVSMIAWMPESRELAFAGAARPLIYYRDGKVEKIRGNRFSIGSSLIDEKKNFEDIFLKPAKGDCIYLTSDGYQDQFGGAGLKKFKIGAFKKLVSEIGHLPVLEQKKAITKTFNEWRGAYDQIDDVLVMGIQF
jgi:serine phosphatase RsbU (regulator of sigma subunit)